MQSPQGPATVSTLKEAEQFAEQGLRDLLYGVCIAPHKLPRVSALRQRGVDLMVVVDSIEAAQAFMAEAGAAAQATLQLLQAQQFLSAGELTLYPAVPAPMARVADLERWQMLLESASRPALQALLRQWSPQLLALREHHRAVVRWALDVDPLSL